MTGSTSINHADAEIGPSDGLISAGHVNRPSDGAWWKDRPEGGVRWVIPGLWPWGYMQLLTGQPKVGKTEVVINLTASLLSPGLRFLDYFEPANLSGDDRGRGIVLINAETPVDAMVDGLMAATEHDRGSREWLVPFHLEQMGGAAVFDLTDKAVFDQWAHRLTWCDLCDRFDDWTPSVVIVDGLTAILAAGGKGVDHYGLWFAQFRQLMIELRVPNALVVGHSTLTGNHSMGGTEALAGPDGLWRYASDNVDNSRAARRFSVTPRLGGYVVPPLRVVRDETGRLVVRTSAETPGAKAESGTDGADQVDLEAKAEREVLEALRQAGQAGLRKTDVTGRGTWGKVKREALTRLVDCGEVVERREGQGSRCWLAEAFA